MRSWTCIYKKCAPQFFRQFPEPDAPPHSKPPSSPRPTSPSEPTGRMHAIRSRLLAQSLPPLIPAPANSFCRSISRRVQSLPSQPLRPVLPTSTYPSTNLNSHNARTMASSSAPLQEWLVIAPDFDGALEKRLAVRPQHIDGLKADPDTFWLWGGEFVCLHTCVVSLCGA